MDATTGIFSEQTAPNPAPTPPMTPHRQGRNEIENGNGIEIEMEMKIETETGTGGSADQSANAQGAGMEPLRQQGRAEPPTIVGGSRTDRRDRTVAATTITNANSNPNVFATSKTTTAAFAGTRGQDHRQDQRQGRESQQSLGTAALRDDRCRSRRRRKEVALGRLRTLAVLLTTVGAWESAAKAAPPDAVAAPAAQASASATTAKPRPPAPPIEYLKTGASLFNKGQYALAAKYLKAADDYRTDLSEKNQIVLDEYLAALNDALKTPAAKVDASTQPASAMTTAPAVSAAPEMSQAQRLLGEAREALSLGRADEARRLATQAQGLNVRYGPNDDTPSQVLAAASQAQNVPITRGGASDPKQKGRWLLKTAREQIMRGELDKAAETVGQVEALNVKWTLFDDSPSKVRKALDQVRATMPAAAGPRDRQAAKVKLRDARAMIERNQLDAAEAAARDVDSWNVRYGMFEDTPEKVLDAIRALRQRDEMRAVGSKAGVTESVYESLVKDARRMMAEGKYEDARAKALQAKQMNVYPSASADRAEAVLYDLGRLETAGKTATPTALAANGNGAPATIRDNAIARVSTDAAAMVISENDPPSVRAEKLASQALAKGDREKAAVLLNEAEELAREELKAKMAKNEAPRQDAQVSRTASAAPAPTPASASPRVRDERIVDPGVNLANGDNDDNTVVVEGPVVNPNDPPAVAPTTDAAPIPTAIDAGLPATVASNPPAALMPPPASATADTPPAPAPDAIPAPASEPAPETAPAPTPSPSSVPMPAPAPAEGTAMLEQAQTLLSAGNFAAARERAAQVKQMSPELAAQADALIDQVNRAESGGAVQFFESAMAALRSGETDRAKAMFNEIVASEGVEPELRERAKSLLDRIASGAAANPEANVKLDSADAQAIRMQKLNSEIADTIAAARRTLQVDPDKAIKMLQAKLDKVKQEDMPADRGKAIVRRLEVQIELAKTEKKDFDVRMRDVNQRNTIEQKRLRILEADKAKQEQVTVLMTQAMESMSNGKYEDAELAAKKAQEVDPNSVEATALAWRARFEGRYRRDTEIAQGKEATFAQEMANVDAAGIVPEEVLNGGVAFPENFKDLSEVRRKAEARASYRKTNETLRIEKKLNEAVNININKQSLGEAMDYLRNYTGLNIVVDAKALADEGLTRESQVTFSGNKVKLKTALKYLLTPIGLTYQIDEEVLVVTNQQSSSVKVRPFTYYVGDLVSVKKVKNGEKTGEGEASDMASSNANESLVNPSMSQSGFGAMAINSQAPLNVLNSGFSSTTLNQRPDYDMTPLIQVITTSIAPGTWRIEDPDGSGKEVSGYGYGALGGAAAGDQGQIGSITPFFLNISLIIRHTDEVHEQIEDLLRQLRRLQDLQVSLEVRFITLSDNFFEELGVDFDFQIQDDTVNGRSSFGIPNPAATFIDPAAAGGGTGGGGGGAQGVSPFLINPNRDHVTQGERPIVVGRNQPGEPETGFSPNLNLPFSQNTELAATPTLAGFIPNAGATFGLAFLSDLEVYLFLRAAQTDVRSNIVQAPRVTTFNGGLASISNTRTQFYVASVRPIVAFGAVAFQPQPAPLPIGISLFAQPVVTADRRYVRLSLSPFFISNESFQNFTVAGGVGGGGIGGGGAAIATTIQLPTFNAFNVNTTVTVPDGGTVLLGGVRESSEERREFGVPVLGKTPFINRLFRNIGIGRISSSVMLMVTPKIIILEEEEERLGIPPAPTVAQ